MKKFIHACTTIAYLLLSATAFSQAPDVQWTKGIGGQQNDYAYCIRETVEGNLVVVGSSNSSADMPGAHGLGYDVFAALLSPSGTPIWGRAFGGNDEDYGFAIRQTPDSGFIIAGATRSTDGDVSGGHGDFDMWVLKISPAGDVQWQTTIGGGLADYAYDIQVTADSGYIVAGRSGSSDGDLTANNGGFDMCIVKLSRTGAIQWQKSLGGSNDENGASVSQTSDGGFIVAGDTYSSDADVTGSRGGEDYWVIRLSPSGSVLWKKCYGGTGAEYAQCVRQTPDGGFIVTGGSNSNNGDVTGSIGGGDIWMLKLSATGTIEWQTSTGSESADVGNSVEVTADSAYLITGYVSALNGDVTEFHGQGDYWLVKMSRTGHLLWQKCVGSLGNENATSGIQLHDGSFAVVGHTTILAADWPGTVGIRINMFVVKFGLANGIEDEKYVSGIFISPNPCVEAVTISGIETAEILVHDVAGREMIHTRGNKIDFGKLQPGLYFVSVFGEDGELLKCIRLLRM